MSIFKKKTNVESNVNSSVAGTAVDNTENNEYLKDGVDFLLKHVELYCQTAHCGRCKPHADFGENTSPIEPYRYRPQNYSGMTADCRSFI